MSTSAERRALLVVDVQPTFCEGGALPVPGGHAVAEAIARFAAAHREEYALVVTTQDWHIEPGRHFAVPPEVPDFVDTWPPHGVAGTAEAELHPALADLRPDASVRKGAYAAAYSGFEGTDEQGRELRTILQEAGITAVDVVGLAESHCVLATTLDALAAGLSARVLLDLTAPVTAEQGAAARRRMTAAGAQLLASSSV
ncbi:isochorismatase family protein [Actinotalea sp.]|uniref:isochorismatase family protein n=1 Tax=Actinotalea sp. TaxID=1872145 RepID=UPI0035616A2A